MKTQEIIILLVLIFLILFFLNNNRQENYDGYQVPYLVEKLNQLPQQDNSNQIYFDKNSSYGDMSKGGMDSLQNLPQSIRTILEEVGNDRPTKSQLERLEKALRQYIPNPKALVAEIRNVPKDSKGMPQISKEKLLLYMLMIALFINSGGKFFKEEVSEDAKSYGAMPECGMKGNIQNVPPYKDKDNNSYGNYTDAEYNIKPFSLKNGTVI